MAADDVDLDALAPKPRRAKLGGKWHLVPGDMPMPLFLRIQSYEARAEAGEDETAMLAELHEEILALFQVHQPTMKVLPEIGVQTLLKTLGAIYGGEAPGEATPNRAARRQKKRTPSPPATARAKRARTSA